MLALLPAFGIIAAAIGAVVGYFGRRQANAAGHSTGKLLSTIGLGLGLVIFVVQLLFVLFWTTALIGLQSGGMI